jgi:hypothetical protein
MRVRRDNDDAEQNIGFDANGDFDTAAIATFVGSGNNGYVSKWYDQSGNGKDAAQSTNGSQPQIYGSSAVLTVNGKSALKFDGSNDHIDIDNTGMDIGNLTSMIVAKSNNASPSQDMALSLSGSNAKRWYAPYIDGGNFNFGYASSTTLRTASHDTDQHVFTAIAGTTLNGYGAFIDGSQVGTTATRDTGLDASQTTGLGFFLNSFYGEISAQELIIWNADQSSNRSAIETDINNYFSIY